VTQAEEAGEVALELGRKASGRQPEVERRIDEMHQILIVEHPSRNRDGHPGCEVTLGPCRGVILAHEVEDLRAQALRVAGTFDVGRRSFRSSLTHQSFNLQHSTVSSLPYNAAWRGAPRGSNSSRNNRKPSW
jgi:hypothetical protein